MKRFSVYCELAGGDYALGWVDTMVEALALAATESDRRTRIWDRNAKYLDSNDGFWRRTIDGIRVSPTNYYLSQFVPLIRPLIHG